MRRFYLSIICLLLVGALLSCSKDTIASSNPEVFQGELTVTRIDQVFTRTDKVALIIDGNQYNIVHQTRTSNLCDSRGTQSGFGSNFLTLTPKSTDIGSCDKIRVPYGRYKAVFKGDSLYLGPTTLTFTVTVDEQQVTETWEYSFKLKQ